MAIERNSSDVAAYLSSVGAQTTAQQKVAAPPNAARPTRCRLRDAHCCRLLLLLLLALQANPTLLKQQKAATLLWCKTT